MHTNRAPVEEIYMFQKEIADVIKNDEKGIVTVVQDESIVIAGSWARKHGYRRRICVSYVYIGLHSKTTVFGLLTTDGRRIFRQYGKFDMHAFARFLKTQYTSLGRSA